MANSKQKGMFKRATRADVASLAGVSVATVSYVVNRTSNPVAVKTRQRVLEAVKQLNYTPHAIARSLKTGNSFIVGLLIPAVTSPGMAFLASTVQDILMRQDFLVIMANAHENIEIEEKMAGALLAQSVDGMIVSPASRYDKKMIEPVIRSGIPLVFMDRYINGIKIDSVTTNNIKAGRDGTEYLIRQGCRRIVCLCFNCMATSADERVKGYKEALKLAGYPVFDDEILIINEPRDVAKEFSTYHEKFGVPDGVICTTQELGIELLNFARQNNITISNRNIVVFDAEWGGLLSPPVAVIRQNLEQVAKTAANLLISRMKGDQSGPHIIQIDAELLVPLN